MIFCRDFYNFYEPKILSSIHIVIMLCINCEFLRFNIACT
uniref:Uncharacterized protein n=1 Tax=Rhizophora mucronata TaxID=61149 RepID=A0A2P2NH59_RHIMU